MYNRRLRYTDTNNWAGAVLLLAMQLLNNETHSVFSLSSLMVCGVYLDALSLPSPLCWDGYLWVSLLVLPGELSRNTLTKAALSLPSPLCWEWVPVGEATDPSCRIDSNLLVKETLSLPSPLCWDGDLWVRLLVLLGESTETHW